MEFTGAKPCHAAHTGPWVRRPANCRPRAFSTVLGITVLLATGMLAVSCGEDAPTTPSAPEGPSTPAPRSTPTRSNRAPIVTQVIPDQVFSSGRGALHIIKADRHFSDPDNDPLSFRSSSSNQSIIEVGINNDEILLGVRGEGVVAVTVTATDPPARPPP